VNPLQIVFVFGFFPVSPGKTVVSTAICRGLLNKGFKLAPFKPRSGHNLWYQHNAFLKCRKEARLYCEDIIKLKKASRCSLQYEILNPIDALLAPLNARTFLEKENLREMYIIETSTFYHLLVERYTLWKDGMLRTTLCVNEKNLLDHPLIDRDYIRGLKSGSDEVLSILDVNGWNSIFKGMGPDCTSTCSWKIAEEHELMVVEGYNDAVCPAPRLRYDVVVGVAPGVAALYNPSDFHRVIDVKSKTGGDPMGMIAEEIVNYIKPEIIFSIPALHTHDINNFDLLSQRLEDMIDTLVELLSDA